MMNAKTEFDLVKIEAAILKFETALDDFETAYTELKEFTDGAKERLRQERERNRKRIHELELLLAGTPSQMLRDVEVKIKLKREKANADWTSNDAGLQRAIEADEAERERLIAEIARTPARPEETELAQLRSIKRTLSSESQEKIQELYDVAMHKYNELRLAKENIRVDLKDTVKAMEQCYTEILKNPLLSMGDTYVNNIKKEADAFCEEA